MKLQFKHQKFQADAAKAVCDVFAGKPYLTPTYRIVQSVTLTAKEQHYVQEKSRCYHPQFRR